ncbi:MAG: cation:proton antiporter family protein [Pseudomonadota bacterium]
MPDARIVDGRVMDLVGTDALPVLLAVAFALGMAARVVGLPPMVGFLVAGFILHSLGVRPSDELSAVADLGVLLLLFIIGLNLKLSALFKVAIIGTATAHLTLWAGSIGALIWLTGAAGFGLFETLGWRESLLLAFALSFSSTVFAVKLFDDKGEMKSVHGQTAIGILIFQDVAAVIFLTASGGQLPTVWAFALIALLVIRPVLFMILDRLGHGEMIPLFGLFALLVLGAASFKLVGLKPDLGALILGMLLAEHRRAREVADSLIGFKEVFLIGFFLQIGLDGIPSAEVMLTALGLIGLLVLKFALFFLLFVAFRLRARTALLGGLGLATYSEFGLIVGAVAVNAGMIGSEWLTILALALALSFAVMAPFNAWGHGIYARYSRKLRRWEHRRIDEDDEPIRASTAAITIFGMGRLGQAIYRRMAQDHDGDLVGIETNPERVTALRANGWNVVHGDATDSDFWARASRADASTRAVLLAMPEHKANAHALQQIRAQGFTGYVAAIARYPDEVEALRESGADFALDLFGEAGRGFAEDVGQRLADEGLDALFESAAPKRLTPARSDPESP